MKKLFGTAVVTAGALVPFVFFASTASIPVAAQQRAAGQATTAPAGSIPHTSWDGKPDLTGVWGPATTGESPNQDARQATAEERNAILRELERLYQPWARERTNAVGYLDDPRLRCGPYGFPRYVNLPDYFLLQIVQAPKETLVLVVHLQCFPRDPHGWKSTSQDNRPFVLWRLGGSLGGRYAGRRRHGLQWQNLAGERPPRWHADDTKRKRTQRFPDEATTSGEQPGGRVDYFRRPARGGTLAAPRCGHARIPGDGRGSQAADRTLDDAEVPLQARAG
jgi:hypothetical protein